MIAIAFDQRLTFFQRLVGIAIMMHLNVQNGQCNPSVIRVAEYLGASETAVTNALQAIYDLGYFHYPPNRGGKGKSHQFTFLINPNQAGGLANNPTTRMGVPTVVKPPTPQRQIPNPPTARGETAPTPQRRCPKPPTAVGRNSLNSLEDN